MSIAPWHVWYRGRKTGKSYGWRPHIQYVIRAPSVIEGTWVYHYKHLAPTRDRDQAMKYIHRYAADEVCSALRKNSGLAWHVIPRVQAISIISMDFSTIEQPMLNYYGYDLRGAFIEEQPVHFVENWIHEEEE